MKASQAASWFALGVACAIVALRPWQGTPAYTSPEHASATCSQSVTLPPAPSASATDDPDPFPQVPSARLLEENEAAKKR